MGYTACTMDTKRGNASPVHSQSGSRGQMSLKSSPFCPRSSSRLTQYIIEDHMVSHYRKVYSAKAAIDVSVPKSMLHSVKYHDQLRRDELRTRPQSAQSQRSSSRAGTRASCVSESQVQGRRSAQGDESAYFCLGSSLLSSPRLNTSFHAKQVVYPSQTLTGSATSPRRPPRSASEFSYGNPAPQRQHSARSCATTGSGTGQDAYKAFQDPAQKTYSGDLLQKHSGRFTQDKPFTPRTLRSESRSYLSQYRYYTPPRRKAAQDGTGPRLTRQETYHGCASAKDCSSPELDDPPQGLGVEHGWSDDEPFNNHSAPERHSKASRSRNSDLHLPSYRMSPDGMKSPIMRRVSDEEEELRYLEFIADVTNEILLRGLYSDRVLERVFERHVERNKLRLDEDKMRHLLEVLRNDLQSPAGTPTCRATPEQSQGHLPPPHRHPQSPDTEVTFDTKEDRDLFAYASFTKDRGELGGAVPLAVSMAIGGQSPDETAGEHVQNQEEQHNHSRDSVPLLEENTDPTPTTNDTEEDLRRNPVDDHDDGVCGELEELGRTLAESLCVSGGPQGVTEPGNTGASLSDDEF